MSIKEIVSAKTESLLARRKVLLAEAQTGRTWLISCELRNRTGFCDDLVDTNISSDADGAAQCALADDAKAVLRGEVIGWTQS